MQDSKGRNGGQPAAPGIPDVMAPAWKTTLAVFRGICGALSGLPGVGKWQAEDLEVLCPSIITLRCMAITKVFGDKFGNDFYTVTRGPKWKEAVAAACAAENSEAAALNDYWECHAALDRRHTLTAELLAAQRTQEAVADFDDLSQSLEKAKRILHTNLDGWCENLRKTTYCYPGSILAQCCKCIVGVLASYNGGQPARHRALRQIA